MFYKLSNTANLQVIEDAFDSKFKYPKIYKKNQIINGLSEQSLPIITMNNPNEVNYAIWGLLPQDFKEGWGIFQNLTNTLNVSIDEIGQFSWMTKLLRVQRCSVIVTGFFTSYYYNGEVYPFYVYQKKHVPFALSGIYSKLDDGFLTVGLVTSNLKNELKEVHNLGNDFPVALNFQDHQYWLDPNIDFEKEGFSKIEKLELKAHPISKEFYNNNIVFDDVLEPAHYKDLPILSIK